MKITICLLALTFAGSIYQHDGSALAQTRTRRPAPTGPRVPAAQKEAPAPPMPILPDIRNDPDVEAADVALIANVTIEELRFDAVPNPTVEFLGKPKTSNIWHADRFNLPDQVQPGVTYRNVGIRLKITSRLADIERIVSEALGEVPINDNPPDTIRTPLTSTVSGSQTARAPLKNSPSGTSTKSKRGPNE